MDSKRFYAFFCCCAALGFAVAGCEDNLTPAPTYDPYESGQLEPLSCVPNLDGSIEAKELREAFDIPVSYLVNPAGSTRPVDLAGQVNPAGQRLWDWSALSLDDQVATVSATALEGKWYASSFAQGQFVVPSDLSGSLDGIYSRDDEGFYLWGIASTQESPPEGQTLLIYDQPIALFRFPLVKDKRWVSVGQARNSKVRGLPYAGKDTYEVKVEAVGELRLPDLSFEQALQVRTMVTLEPAVGQSIKRQQISYLFECFGEVARAVSADGEQESFFTEAVELRRLGIGL